MTEPAQSPTESDVDPELTEFRDHLGFNRPHHFGPVLQLAGGGVSFAAKHEKLQNWTFTITPRREAPRGYVIEAWSIGQNPISVNDVGENLYDLPGLQRTELGDPCPSVAFAIDAAKTYLAYLMADLERIAWEGWQNERSAGADQTRACS